MARFIVLFALLTAACGHSTKVQPSLLKALANRERADILVSVIPGTKSVLDQLTTTPEFLSSTRQQRATAVHAALNAHAEQSQAPLLKLISTVSSPPSASQIRSLWVSNQILVQGADLELIQSLAKHPFVGFIAEDGVVQLQEPRQRALGKSAQALQWNIRRMRAPEAWEALGSNGTGATVADISTGARATHRLLRHGYKGADGKSYAWFNPNNVSSLTPHDDRGFGSFNLGLLAGEDGYGVAPGAKWIACKAFIGTQATHSALLACGQFIACPHDPSGDRHDCSQAPDVVSNSWESPDDESGWFASVIAAWHAAGVVPVFGAGSHGLGNRCRSITYPADSENVIAVGTLSYNSDYIEGYSSRGPSKSGGQKPQIACPGDNVYSADSYNDEYIVGFFGVSQAAPHIAGLVALLRSANPELSYEEVLELLQDHANRDQASYLQQCGGRFDFVWPNYHFGHGRADALASANALLESMTRAARYKCFHC